MYNFFLKSNINKLFDQIYNAIISNQNLYFKINYSFGYILRNVKTGVLWFFHPSFNNHCVLNTAKLINNSNELSRFLDPTTEHNLSENISRPDTKWAYLSITNITFYVNKLENAPIGHSEKLPNFLLYNQCSLFTYVYGTLHRDFLCFFIV